MIKKIANYTLRKVKEKTVSELEHNVADLGVKLERAQTENNRLISELTIEQRQREDSRSPFGGVFQISAKEVVTKIFSGFIMYLDPRDIAVVPHIILEGIWEREVTMAWLEVLKRRSDAIVLDIGANFGYFGLLAAQNLDKKAAKVVLFEANPNLLPYIHKTLSVNWLNENTVVEGLAVADKNGKAQLNVLEDYTGSSSMHTIEHLDAYLSHKMHIKAESVIDVQSTTIDSYCEKHGLPRIDIIKMDIEGYEEKAYQGMRQMVAASPDTIMFIEFTKDGYEQPKQFYDQMVKDFGNVYTIDSSGELVVPKNTSYESIFASVDDWIMLVFSKQPLVGTKHQAKTAG